MQRNNILLSTGSLPWLTASQLSNIAEKAGFSGIELVPTRSCLTELQKTIRDSSGKEIKKTFPYIMSIHHSWKLDARNDAENGINRRNSIFYGIIRSIFFPSTKLVRNVLSTIIQTLRIPLTVHRLDREWICDNDGMEFDTDICLELLNTDITKEDLRQWLTKNSHFLILDTRDDQSLIWAKSHGFNDWKDFWEWITLEKIKGLQVTLIGSDGIERILKKKLLLAEEQLLWLYNRKWSGSVTLEINPLSLFLASGGNIHKGLRSIHRFIEKTLIHGKKWSD